jgi:hypothetical protein
LIRSVAFRRSTLALSLLLLSGCFRYVPVPLEVVPDGEDVRLLVTRQGAFELSEVTNVETGAAPTLRGTVVGREPETLMVRVPVGARQEGIHTVTLGQTIRVPEGEILQVERREFDAVKTGGLVAGVIGGSVFIIVSIMDAFGGDQTNGDPPQPPESRIPVPFVRIPIGR